MKKQLPLPRDRQKSGAVSLGTIKNSLVDDKTLAIRADIGSEKRYIRAFDYRVREFSWKAI